MLIRHDALSSLCYVEHRTYSGLGPCCILPNHGHPYPHRQGAGRKRVPVTRIAKDMSDPITGWPLSATQSRIALSESFLSAAVPPHQYVMSCSTQQPCQTESGHNVHPSVRNLRSGTNSVSPRRSKQRSSASFCRSPGNRVSERGSIWWAHPVHATAATIAATAKIGSDVTFRFGGRARTRWRICRRLSHVD